MPLIYPFRWLRVRSLRARIARLEREAQELKQVTDYVPLRVAQVRTQIRAAQAELATLQADKRRAQIEVHP